MAPPGPDGADLASRVTLDRSSPVPLYYQVAGALQRLIETDALPPGSRLTNEIELADRLGVSRPTMRRAIQYLVDRGQVVRKRGVGTQVVRSRVNRPLDLTSLHDDLARDGRSPTTQVLEVAREPAGEVPATALGVRSGAEVVRVRRLRSADGEPIALLTNYLPSGLLELSVDRLSGRGLYDLMRAAGVQIRVADQTIGATAATAEQAALLGERKGAALLTMTRTAYDDVGRAVEYGTHVYRASRYSFSLTLVDR
jgi:DNA-binding GntR family transcriptional regulator